MFIFAPAVISRRSQARAHPMPAPAHAPFTAATVTAGISWSRVVTWKSGDVSRSSASPDVKWLRSAPGQNDDPAPVSTSTRRVWSVAASSSASRASRTIRLVIPLRCSGRFRVRRASPPSTS